MKRPTIFLMLAMVAAVLAFIVVFSALRNRETQVQMAKAQNEEIVVAARDVQLGEKLTRADVKLVRWSRLSVPEGAFTDTSSVANAYAKNELIDGQPVVSRNLIQADRMPGVMPLIIKPGMRAMAIAVDDVGDIAGFVKPHIRVDVLVALASIDAQTRPFSKIVLQNLEVLAVAQQIDKGKDEAEIAKVVTLMVTPHQAEKLGLAGREGVLRLAMRNYADDKMVETSGSDFADLLGIMAPAAVLNPELAAPLTSQPFRFHGAAGHHPFAVQIMRDGKNDETVSFLAGGLGAIHSSNGEPATAPVKMPSATVLPPPETTSPAIVASPTEATPPAETSSNKTVAPATGAAIAAALMTIPNGPVRKTLDVR